MNVKQNDIIKRSDTPPLSLTLSLQTITSSIIVSGHLSPGSAEAVIMAHLTSSLD